MGWNLTKKIFSYVLIGVGLGALIHGFVPVGFFEKFLKNSSWWSVPLATILAIPLYSNAVGVIPVVQALVVKGVPLGTALSFMMATVGLSLPEALILKRAMKIKLLILFFFNRSDRDYFDWLFIQLFFIIDFMDRKIILTTALISFIILIFVYILVSSAGKKEEKNSQNSVLPSKEKIVFYYGNTCPHCADVEEWMKKEKIEEKIKIEKKEVYQNQANAQELNLVAQSCGLDPNTIGVPFLYADGKCYIGTPEVERILKNKVGK